MDRRQIERLSDTELQVAVDGMRLTLSRAWSRGERGSLSMLYDLAMCSAEADVRGMHLRALPNPDQITLFD